MLGLGRAGTPRKLGVKGEELPKVMYRLIEADHYINKKILVVGRRRQCRRGGHGSGANRRATKSRSPTARKLSAASRSGTLNASKSACGLVRSKSSSSRTPVEFKTNSVVLEVTGQSREIPNDFVWIFAGGEPPSAFLKKIGVGFGARDITAQGSSEAKQAAEEAGHAKLMPA